jgi:hypothetical protein
MGILLDGATSWEILSTGGSSGYLMSSMGLDFEVKLGVERLLDAEILGSLGNSGTFGMVFRNWGSGFGVSKSRSSSSSKSFSSNHTALCSVPNADCPALAMSNFRLAPATEDVIFEAAEAFAFNLELLGWIGFVGPG